MALPREHLIVMTRLPMAGKTKTRLIPALGPQGAADLHDQLARHAIGRASAYALTRPHARLEVRMDGGSAVEAQAWLGGNCPYKRQHRGDLGERINHAIAEAFDAGAEKVVVIGTDCPTLDEEDFAAAFDALDAAPLVIAPAHDGGYVMIGMTQPFPMLFAHIDWGGPEVFSQTLKAAKNHGISPEILKRFSDVDLPDDLPAAREALASGASLSVIIPTLNEVHAVPTLISLLRDAGIEEILIADGGSEDGTRTAAREAGATVVTAPRGRAAQMNAAAKLATGELLLFLHADTHPPEGFPTIITETLQSPGVAAGAFGFSLGDDYPPAALIEALVDWRCRLRHLPYGDQGFFIRRRIYNALGGFPDLPVMEDYAMVKKARKCGRVVTTRASALTSPRRWQEGGLLRTFFCHQLMLTAYHLGLPLSWLAQLRH